MLILVPVTRKFPFAGSFRFLRLQLHRTFQFMIIGKRYVLVFARPSVNSRSSGQFRAQ